MGFMLHVEAEGRVRCPDSFSHDQGRVLFAYIQESRAASGSVPNVLGKFEDKFHLDLEPIKRIGGPDWGLEDFDMNEEWFNQAQAENLASWQSPTVLMGCAQSVLQVLDEHPTVFADLGVSESYFLDNGFRQNMVELLAMISWAKELGVAHVRIAGE